MIDGPAPTRENLVEALCTVGVAPGDTIYVASSIAGLSMMQDPIAETLAALFEAVGEQGTIVMPTFNFAFCEGAPFDVGQTPSTCGQLTEAFRQLPGVLRSYSPPYHSFAVWGKRSHELMTLRSTTSFGPTSIFQRLHDLNARHVLLGVGFDAGVAQVHWLEETLGVPYRDWKAFEGDVLLGGDKQRKRYLMYARRRDVQIALDADPLGEQLKHAGCVLSSIVGLCEIQSFLLQDFSRVLRPRLEGDRLALLTPESRDAFLRANRSQPKHVMV